MAIGDLQDMIVRNAKQQASALFIAYAVAHGINLTDRANSRYEKSMVHFHDGSMTEIAWNDVEAIQMFNELTGDNIPVPFTASEGYNQHGHTGAYDGGFIPGMGPHDHRDNFNGGFAFACYHPGTSIPQQPWSI
jgi:hypothetical protein